MQGLLVTYSTTQEVTTTLLSKVVRAETGPQRKSKID